MAFTDVFARVLVAVVEPWHARRGRPRTRRPPPALNRYVETRGGVDHVAATAMPRT